MKIKAAVGLLVLSGLMASVAVTLGIIASHQGEVWLVPKLIGFWAVPPFIGGMVLLLWAGIDEERNS